MRIPKRTIACAAAAALLLTGCWPVPPPDDAGAAAFYEQFLPLVLGRRLRNAQERQYLLDLEALYGRQVVMDLLMGEPEFVETWKDNLIRHLQLQREGGRKQDDACFGGLLRLSGEGDGGELARFIRDNPVTANYPGTSSGDLGVEALGDDAFNMADVIHSAIEEDDLSIVYKAYTVPLVIADGDLGAEEVGKAFNRAFLNRNLDCTECHNIEFSYTVIYPIPIDLEPPVFGCTKCAGDGVDQSEIWSVFRQDITGDDAPGGVPTIRPWGLHPSCGTLATEFTGASQPTVFAGLGGGFTGLPHLVDELSAGVESIRAGGLSFSSGDYQESKLPPAQSLVYLMSAKIVEDVWEDLLGSRLTEAHNYARVEGQQEMHRFLTESFIGSDWSLRELISLIMVTGYANRRAPAESLQQSESVLAPIFDSFAGPNGQGDLVFRYPPYALFSQLHHSLGWPKWKAFPDDSYPSLDLNRDLDQYLSDGSAGSSEWGFQSLLAWEAAVATCENPEGSTDWIDRLVQSVEDFDAAHPEDPLTVRDLVKTVKDRLIGDPRISNGPTTPPIDDLENDGGHGICCAPEPPDDYANPGDGDEEIDDLQDQPPVEGDTELEVLEAMFGTGLHNPASSVGDLELKLRRLCGTLLKSPQRLLAGIVDRDAAAAPPPRLSVGNAGEPVSYPQICESYRPGLARLGIDVSCGPGGISQVTRLALELYPHQAARREDAAKRVRNSLAALEGSMAFESRLTVDPRTGGPIPEEDLETLLAWARTLAPEELADRLPAALLYGAPPDAASYDRMLSEARRTLGVCERDSDGDSLCDDADPCLTYPNRLPLVDTDKDGIPDECQCGDADGSGLFDSPDVAIASECAVNDPAAARIRSCISGIVRGDANGSGRFEREDSTLIQQVLGGKTPAYSLRCALRPEGTAPAEPSRR
jgi:hypothetical protein